MYIYTSTYTQIYIQRGLQSVKTCLKLMEQFQNNANNIKEFEVEKSVSSKNSSISDVCVLWVFSYHYNKIRIDSVVNVTTWAQPF